MKNIIDKYGPTTVVMIAAFLVAAIAGAVVTAINPDTLSFNDYLDQLAKFAGTLGLLAIGRGVHAATTKSPLLAPSGVLPQGSGQGNAGAGATTTLSVSGTFVHDGPGDEDALPHIEETDPSTLPPDADDFVPENFVGGDKLRTAGYSGLSPYHRKKAKSAILAAINLCFAHSSSLHYTQGSERWQGIALHLNPRKGQFPTQSDCSSWDTWILWSALNLIFGQGDRVNGTGWRSGFTGTMLNHGKTVVHQSNWQVGDSIFYGVKGTTGKHVAIYIGGGYVASHGSEGVHKLVWNYRSDFMVCKRYI